MANIEMNDYEAVTDRTTVEHMYLTVGDDVKNASAAAVNRNNTATARFSWKKTCILLFGGILLGTAISIATVVVYDMIVGSGPSASPDEATAPSINISDVIDTQLKTIVRELVEEKLKAIVQVPVTVERPLNTSEKAVAFSVTTPTGSLVGNSPIFSKTLLNTGSYNQTTGAFTCPIAGIYLFSVTLYADSSTTSKVGCNYQINGYKKAFVYSYHDAHDTISGPMVVALQVGDIMEMYCAGWDNVDRGYGTTFSGVLITPN